MAVLSWKNIVTAAIAGLALTGPAPAQDGGGDSALSGSPIPERRLTLRADTDMPGGDLAQLFDTTLQACIQACLGNDRCQALTYNERSRACFPKGDAGAPSAFEGAVSGYVVAAAPERLERAAQRARAADFLPEKELGRADRQARTFVAMSRPLGTEGTPASDVRPLELDGRKDQAARLLAAFVARDDNAQDWVDLARLTLETQDKRKREASDSAALMAINGYLRAADDSTAAQALLWLAQAYDRLNRGRDGLAALRLANRLAPENDQIAQALDASEDVNGMRVTGTEVDADGKLPRVCAVLSRELSSGTDYTPFLRLPEGDLTVDPDGNQLSVAGMSHGQNVEITLRAGLPAKSGEALPHDYTLNAYIRDRKPEIRFPGRAYVLPASGDQRLSMVTVNADEIALRLLRISDRNLIRAMSESMFATPLDAWQSEYFSSSMARQVWKGTAQVAKPMGQDALNRELTTSLAIPAEAGPLEPGIYIVEAGVAGQSAGDTGLATQWFVISDFGISTYAGADGLTVLVRSLQDVSARPGVEVALISRSNEVLARAQTDDQGRAHFAPGLSLGRNGAEPALVTVTEWQGTDQDRAPRDMAFLSLADPEFDLSDRGVEGAPPAPPLDLFVAADRGAYRVGETVNATILARDPGSRALADLPLTAVILRPDGVEQTRFAPTPAGAGGSTLAWQIPGNAPRGTWRLELRTEADGPALSTTRLLVEDFLPERIDFTPTLPEGTARAGGTLDLSLAAHWLFGAPAAELPVEGQLRLAPARALDGFAGYAFGREDDDSQPVSDILPAGETDAQGNFSAQITLPGAELLAPRPYEASVIVNIREGAGRPVERVQSRMVMPQSPVIGIRPLFEGDTVPEGSEARFALLAVGPDLKPASSPVRWVLNRLDTEYQWYSVGGQWNWEVTTSRRRVTEGVAEPGEVAAEIAALVDWGQYEILAEPASGEGGQSSVRFYAGWGAIANSGSETPDRLQVVLDRPAYRSGETAQVKVQAASDGLGVVSVLSNRLISMQTVSLSEGENEIALPVTDDWGAGVYVTVSAIRPLQGAEPGDRRPVRALGLAHAAVDPGDRLLSAAIEAPQETRPRGMIPVTLRVEGAGGATVHATIAAVDQGILNLTGYMPPDPAAHYFGQRRLGVGLRDLYGRLILPSGAPDGALREGGDASLSANAEAPPPTEKLMSWFSGPITLDADGTAQVQVPVGDFNGEVRVMAVLWSDNGVGQADASVLVRDPVVLTVTAPAFLAPGDQAEVGLRLTHATGPAGEMRLSVTQTAGAPISASLPTASVTLAEQAEAQLQMPVTAGDSEGRADLRLTLTTPDGAELTKDITIPLSLNEADIQRQIRTSVAPGASVTVPAELTQGMLPGALLTAAVGPYARLDVASTLARLSRYPYGCTEQLTSGAMPLLYLSGLETLEGVNNGADDGLTERLQDAIGQILTRQASNGGFGLWYADSGDLWLGAYVTDFLSRARSAGYQVSDTAFNMAIANLRNRVNYAGDPQHASASDNAALAYALAVLARERAATVGDLRYYVDTAARYFSTPMAAANLGAALASYGDQLRADRMFTQARELVDLSRNEAYSFRPDYGTQLRDAAALLAIAADARTQAIDLTELTNLVSQRLDYMTENRRWVSTQESIWTVLAARALSQTAPPALLNGAAISQAVIGLPDNAASIANTGSAPLEVTMTATGKPAQPPAQGGRGYRIERSYYSIEGAPIDPVSLPQGTRMVAVLRVYPDSEGGGRLIIADPLPAGWEIDNPNLLRAGDISALSWLEGESSADMTEFRADRFAAALTWTSQEPITLAYILRAVTPGNFRLPAASVEDMYRPEYRAWSDGGWVSVTR